MDHGEYLVNGFTFGFEASDTASEAVDVPSTKCPRSPLGGEGTRGLGRGRRLLGRPGTLLGVGRGLFDTLAGGNERVAWRFLARLRETPNVSLVLVLQDFTFRTGLFLSII